MAAAGKSVLVVEDDPSVRLLCRVNLELEGFRVREADRLDEARAAVAEEAPGLVFLDVHLGGQSSEAFLDELVEAAIPVVVVSGSTDLSRYRGRATDFLSKPFEPTMLASLARRYVG